MTRLAIVLALISLPLFAATFETDIDAAFKRAKKEKKPLLVDFYGIWCPPCNELDGTVFEAEAFLSKAKDFVLLKVDADKRESWKVKSKYKIGGYPTILFANPAGKEIYRLVGYRPLPEFLKVMDVVLAAKGKDLEKSCASADVEDLWRCAVICSERKEEACAEKAFRKLEKKLTAGSPRYLETRAYFVEHSASPDLKRKGYEDLLTEYPASPRALLWALEYLESHESLKGVEPKKALVEKAIAEAPKAEKDPALVETGLTVSDLKQMRADLLDKLGRPEEAKSAWKEAAAHLEQVAAGLQETGSLRGFNLERVSCLEQAGQLDAALALANELREKYPDEFTFHYVAASVLSRAKRYPEALKAGKTAFDKSYGDNRVRVATLLVESYASVPDKESAKQVYEKVRAEVRPDAKLDVRTHRYLKRLDEAWKKAFGTLPG